MSASSTAPPPLRNIAIIGATGTLGPPILSALLARPHFRTTVLTRASSRTTFPPSSAPHSLLTYPDSPSDADLRDLVRGHDAVVCCVSGSLEDLQVRLASAARLEGVRLFVPADFGSCDSSSERARRLVPLYAAKWRVQEHLRALVREEEKKKKKDGEAGRFAWTSIVCGHFFDHGLESGLLQFRLAEKKARLFDGGSVRFSASTLGRVAEAVVAVLEGRGGDAVRNRQVYVQSVCASQRDVLGALARAMPAEEGEEDGGWEVEEKSSEEYIEETGRRMAERPGDGEAVEEMVSVVGIVDANWEGKEGFANGILGLADEDLDELVRRVVKEVETGGSSGAGGSAH